MYPRFRVILHNLRRAYNVGSIFRTADAIGVEKFILLVILLTRLKIKKLKKLIWMLKTVFLRRFIKNISTLLKKLKKKNLKL